MSATEQTASRHKAGSFIMYCCQAMKVSEPETPSFKAWNAQFQSLKHLVSNARNTQFQGLKLRHPPPSDVTCTQSLRVADVHDKEYQKEFAGKNNHVNLPQ